MKKHIVPIIAILCIGGIILAACVAKSTPDAQPVDAPAASVPAVEPIDTAEPEPEPAVEPEPEPEPQPEPEPEPEFHCNFDEAVNEFIEANPDIDLTLDPIPLYEYLVSEGIDSYYVQSTMCDNEHAIGFIRWQTGNDLYNPNQPTMEITDPNELHLHQATPEELEEDERRYEEIMRQREAEAAEAEANATNNNGRGNNF